MRTHKIIAALLSILLLPGIFHLTLAEEIRTVTLGDGDPIPYLDGFNSRLIRDSGQMSGITGGVDVGWQQAGNTGSQVKVQLQNIALTDDVLAVFYRAEYEERVPLIYGTAPISYEYAAPYLNPSVNGAPLPVIGLWKEGHPDGENAVLCLSVYSLETPVPDQSILSFEDNDNPRPKQDDPTREVRMDRSQSKDPTTSYTLNRSLNFTYERYPGRNTSFDFTVRRISFGPFGNRIQLSNLDQGRDSGILDCLLEDERGNSLPIRSISNTFSTLASPAKPIEMENEIWFFGGEEAEAIRIVPVKILSQTAPTLPFYTLPLHSEYPVVLPLKNGSKLTINAVELDENGFTVNYTSNIVGNASFTPGNSEGEALDDLFYGSSNSFDLPSQTFLMQGLWMAEHQGQLVSRVSEQVIQEFTTLRISSYVQDYEVPLPELAVAVPLKEKE